MDIWSFGFIAHKIITRDLPSFDPTRKPVLNKTHFSPGMHDLIVRCLSLTPSSRPSWQDINLRDLEASIIVQDVEEDVVSAGNREVIRLGTGKERSSSMGSRVGRVEKVIEEDDIINLSEKNRIVEDEEAKLKEEE